jgi:hypothetical protein
MEHLDPHQRPPDSIKNVYKKYQKIKLKDLDQDLDIVDLPASLHTSAKDKVRIVEEWSGDNLTAAFRAFSGQDGQTYTTLPARIPVYEHADMPGKAQMDCSGSVSYHSTQQTLIVSLPLRCQHSFRSLYSSCRWSLVAGLLYLRCHFDTSHAHSPSHVLTVSRSAHRPQPPST